MPTPTLNSEEEVRAAIRAAKASGADSIAEVHYPAVEPPAPITEKETRNLIAGLDEARKIGIPFQIHAVSPNAMVAAAAIGGKKLIHTPHNDWVTEAQAEVIKADGAEVVSCTGFGPPVFDVFNHDNIGTFRDGKPWRAGSGQQRRSGPGSGILAGQRADIVRPRRQLWLLHRHHFQRHRHAQPGTEDAQPVFSPIDMVKIMGPNTAKFIDRGQDLGTLEPGKVADIVMLGGNPLAGFWNFMTAEVVIKGGDDRGRQAWHSPTPGLPMGKPQT